LAFFAHDAFVANGQRHNTAPDNECFGVRMTVGFDGVANVQVVGNYAQGSSTAFSLPLASEALRTGYPSPALRNRERHRIAPPMVATQVTCARHGLGRSTTRSASVLKLCSSTAFIFISLSNSRVPGQLLQSRLALENRDDAAGCQ
jgi:hypothetical protein